MLLKVNKVEELHQAKELLIVTAALKLLTRTKDYQMLTTLWINSIHRMIL